MTWYRVPVIVGRTTPQKGNCRLCLEWMKAYCFTWLSAQSWQFRDRGKPKVGNMPWSYGRTLKIVHSAQYHKQHCTLQTIEQFGALYLHKLNSIKFNSSRGYLPRLRSSIGSAACVLRLKHTTTLFFLCPVTTFLAVNGECHCWPSTDQFCWQAYGAIISQMWQICWLWGILIMVGRVLCQLKPSGSYILSC